MVNSLVKDKSQAFGIRISRMYKYLRTKGEFIISKQILRIGTSISANISEALRAESTADFIHKMNIALKEASETETWLINLHSSEYLNDIEYNSIYPQCIELIKMLTSIVKTSKENAKRNEIEKKVSKHTAKQQIKPTPTMNYEL